MPHAGFKMVLFTIIIISKNNYKDLLREVCSVKGFSTMDQSNGPVAATTSPFFYSIYLPYLTLYSGKV